MKLLSIEQVGETLGNISRQTVMRMIAEGSLPAICIRSGRRKKVWRVSEHALQKWIENKEAETKNSVQSNAGKLQAVLSR